MNRTALWTAYATLYVERFGLSIAPLGEDKRPVVRWLEYQSRRPKVAEIVEWASNPAVENLAILTGEISNICVIDCDSREAAVAWHQKHGGSPVMVRTKRGVHFYYRYPGQKVQNASKIALDDTLTYDVRADGGYVVSPPSVHSEGEYSWIKPLIETDKLPPFDPGWRPERVGQEQSDKKIHDGVKYIQSIRAVSGQGGHDSTYRAAAVLRDSGLSEGEALLALIEWNVTHCDQPWSERDLLHKVRSCYS